MYHSLCNTHSQGDRGKPDRPEPLLSSSSYLVFPVLVMSLSRTTGRTDSPPLGPVSPVPVPTRLSSGGLRLIIFYYFFFLILYHPFREIWSPYLGKDTAAARAALPNPTNACWVFSCFRNPPKSDRAWTTGSLTCAGHHSHACGGWTHRQRVSATFLTREKTLTNLIVLLTGPGFEPPVFGCGVRRSTN